MSEPFAFGDGHLPDLPELELTHAEVLVIGGPPSPADQRAGNRLAAWRPGLLVLVAAPRADAA